MEKAGQERVEAFLRKGLHLEDQGRLEEALSFHEKAVALNPTHFGALYQSGLLAAHVGKHELARTRLSSAVSVAPDDPEAYHLLGGAFRMLRRFGDALKCFEKAITLKNDYAEAYNDFAVVLIELRKFDDALMFLNQAIVLAPSYALAYANRGYVLRQLGRFEASLADYDGAIALSPEFADFYLNRGVVLRELHRYEEAINSYRKAVALEPRNFEAYSNLGLVLHETRQLDEALKMYDQAIALNPAFSDAYWNKAISLLLAGDYEKGWDLYEWRWRRSRAGADGNKYDALLWLGSESLEGKTILLHSEQGLGDTIQFCRYLPMVARLGARVFLEAPNALRGLLGDMEGVEAVFAKGEALPAFDYHSPLMSLPLAFETRLNTIPAPVPYLHPDPVKVERWRTRLADRSKLRVGLIWRSGFHADQPETWAANARRDIPLQMIAGLKHSELDFFSLQKGEPAESELAEMRMKVWPEENLFNFADEFEDFSDTAALIENLDLVISADTSAGHLAAALGKPVWFLIKYDGCWRWLLDRTDSPWYPTVKLYRQKVPGDWAEVLERVGTDLRAFASRAT